MKRRIERCRLPSTKSSFGVSPPSGITTTIVNPGFFRTELLTEQSTTFAELSIDDYDERRAKQVAFWKSQNGKQGGDPEKLAQALVTIAGQQMPPVRFIAGADAIASTEQKIASLEQQISALRELSTSLAFDVLGTSDDGGE